MANKINIGAGITLDGEKEYRQAISGINSDMKVLQSEMKLSKSSFEGQANSIEALTSKDKLLNEAYDKQKEKINAIKLALENAKEQYGENDTRVDKWKITLNNAEVKLNDLDNEIKSNKKYLDEAKTSTNNTATSIDKYGKEVDTAKDKTSTFGDVLKANLTGEAIVSGIKAMSNTIKSVGTAAIDSVKDTAAYADEILTMSNNTGIATDTLQELMYMQDLTDVSLETVTGAMARNIRSMNSAKEGTATYADAYKKLGVNITDTSTGALRKSEDVFWECIDALGNMKNETDRDATAMSLFGKSAQDLNSIVKIGSDGVKEFANEATDMGAVLDNTTLKSLGETQDAFDRISQQTDIVKRQFGIALAPAITNASSKISKAMATMGNELKDVAKNGIELVTDGLIWLIDNVDVVVAALKGIATGYVALKAGQAISSVVTTITSIGTAASGATSLLGGLSGVLTANPWGIAAVAIGGITTALMLMGDESDAVSEDVKLLNSEASELLDATEQSLQEALDLRQKMYDAREDIEAEYGSAKNLTDQLYDLAENTNKTSGETALMKDIVEQLNNIIPDLNLNYDENTESLSKNKDEVYKLIEAKEQELRLEAAKEDMVETGKRLYKAEKELTQAKLEKKDAVEKLEEKQKALNDSIQKEIEYQNQINPSHDENFRYTQEQLKALKDLDDEQNQYINDIEQCKDSMGVYNEAINNAASEVSNLKSEYNYAQDYLQKHSGTDTSIQELEKLRESARAASEKFNDIPIIAEISFNNLKETIKNQTSDTYNVAKKAVDNTKFSDIGKFIIQGIESGIRTNTTYLQQTTQRTVGYVDTGLRGYWGIHSPSTKSAEIGKYISQGIGVGFEKDMKLTSEKISKASNFDYNYTAKSTGTMEVITGSIANAVSTAIKALNLTVQVDGTVFGQLVSDSIVEEVFN